VTSAVASELCFVAFCSLQKLIAEISNIPGDGPYRNLIIPVCTGIDDPVSFEGKVLSRKNNSIRSKNLADDESYPH